MNKITLILLCWFVALAVAQAQNDIPENPRAMAEWEEVQAVVINWGDFIWQSFIDEGTDNELLIKQHRDEQLAASELISEVSKVAEVYVIDSREGRAEQEMTELGTDLSNVEILNPESPESMWTRDYGPFSVYENTSDSLTLVKAHYYSGTADITPQILEHLKARYYNLTEEPEKLVFDGGNFLTDGHGQLFMDSTIIPYQKTLDDYRPLLEKAFGLSDIVAFNGIDYHIDYYMKLVNEETFLVSKVSGGRYTDAALYNRKVKQAISYIKDNLKTSFARDYSFTYIETPPDYDNTAENFTALSKDMTYINSLIVNDHVFVPQYGFEPYDSLALVTYDSIMPGYTIVPINYLAWSARAGSIHCVSREIGVNKPIYISHRWLRDTINQQMPELSAYISSQREIKSVNIHWTNDTTAGYETTEMVSQGVGKNGNYIGFIPESSGNEIFYYISVETTDGKIINKPFPGIKGPYHFYKDINTSVKKIPQNGLFLEQNFPNPFRENTTIRYSIPAGKPQQVSLTVLDLSGRIVKILRKGETAPGNYTVILNGSDFTSGIYYYRLVTETGSKIRKMVVTEN